MHRWNWAIAESVGWCIGGILLSVITYYMPISGGSEGWVPTIARVRIEEDIVGGDVGGRTALFGPLCGIAPRTATWWVGGRTQGYRGTRSRGRHRTPGHCNLLQSVQPCGVRAQTGPLSHTHSSDCELCSTVWRPRGRRRAFGIAPHGDGEGGSNVNLLMSLLPGYRRCWERDMKLTTIEQ